MYTGWRYKNTIALILSLAVFFLISDTALVKEWIAKAGELGYLGAFLVGILFVSVFTVAPASLVLFYLAKNLDPVLVAILGGTGAMLGDLLIFRFLSDNVFEELSPWFSKLTGSHVSKFFRTPYFAWVLPVLGAIIIASPVPDEVGLGLLGLSKIKIWQFVLLTFTLNCVGIFLIVKLAGA